MIGKYAKQRYSTLLVILILCTLLSAGCSEVVTTEDTISLDNQAIKKIFKTYDGCFILMDADTGHKVVYNEERVNTPMPPCSTFKIYNSLIGLETGVIKDKNHLYKWDGKERFLKVWNQDHTLESAIENSVVWYYQRLATEVGAERMQKHLDNIGYGNKDISGGIDRFWLDSSLRISAAEQVDLLHRLYSGELPISQQNMDTVKEIMVLESKDNIVLSGKTGSGERSQIGWFVGSVLKDGKRYYFATNIIGDKATGSLAKDMSKSILKLGELY